MLASGWHEDVAVAALEDTLRGFLSDHARANGLPEPRVGARADDARPGDAGSTPGTARWRCWPACCAPRVDRLRSAAVRCRMRRTDRAGARAAGPLRDGQARQRRERGQRGAHQRRHVLRSRRESAVRPDRTAHCRADPAGRCVNGEGLQVLRYGPGAEYRPHYDYFDPEQPGTPAILKRGGQRVASLVMYLNTPTRGGATTFPDAQARGRAGQGQRGLLQLRPTASDDAQPARRRAGAGRREVGRDQVAA